jgi:DNA-binding MarR family transcriptional regulator
MDTQYYSELRTLRVIEEIEKDFSVTQRDLSKRIGIALGMTNLVLKNLSQKGYIKVRAIRPKRLAYYITPKGFSEKTRLAYRYMQRTIAYYRQGRETIKRNIIQLKKTGARKVVLYKANEVAEIVYLTLQEQGLELLGIIDSEKHGGNWFSYQILKEEEIDTLEFDVVILADFEENKKQELYLKKKYKNKLIWRLQ